MTGKSFFHVIINLRRWEPQSAGLDDWRLRDIPPHEDIVWAVDARAAAQQALIPLVSDLDEWTQTAGYTVAPVSVAQALHGLGAPTLPLEPEEGARARGEHDSPPAPDSSSSSPL